MSSNEETEPLVFPDYYVHCMTSGPGETLSIQNYGQTSKGAFLVVRTGQLRDSGLFEAGAEGTSVHYDEPKVEELITVLQYWLAVQEDRRQRE